MLASPINKLKGYSNYRFIVAARLRDQGKTKYVKCNINPQLPITKECVGHKEYVPFMSQ